MTPEQEIELEQYKKALFHYKLCRVFPFMKYPLDTWSGLCLYFIAHSKHRIGHYYLAEHLPTLYSLRPPEEMEYNMSGYWFKPGLLKPRIKLLRQAIEILEQHENII